MTVTMADTNPGNIVFDGSDFLLWKFQLINALEANGIETLIEKGSKPKDGAGLAEWKKKDGKVKSLITKSVSPDQLQHLVMCKTAEEMWNQLCLIHEEKSESNKLGLIRNFHKLQRMEFGESALQFITKIKNQARTLEDVDEKMSDLSIMAKILDGLPSKFDAFVAAWSNIDPTEQKLHVFCERLIKEERRISTKETEVSALAVTRPQGQNKGDKGHEKPAQQNQGKQKSKIVCFNCNREGHYARNCRQKRQGHRGKQTFKSTDSFAQAFVATTSAVFGAGAVPQANAATCREKLEVARGDTSDIWLSDSGASRHMSFRKDWFTDLTPCALAHVMLGDGTPCEVRGTGIVHMERLVNGKWIPGRIENVLYVPDLKKNLFSVGTCVRKGFKVVFEVNEINFFLNDSLVCQGIIQENNVFRMCMRVSKPREANACTVDALTLHERLGHVNKGTMNLMIEKNLVDGVNLEKGDMFCEPCHLAKSHRLSFNKSGEDKRQ